MNPVFFFTGHDMYNHNEFANPKLILRSKALSHTRRCRNGVI